LHWAIDIKCGKARDGVVFDGFDRRLCCIHTVVVWRDYLDVYAVVFDVGLDCFEAFVVQDMELYRLKPPPCIHLLCSSMASSILH